MHLNGRPFDREDLPAVRALFRGEVVTREEFNMVVGDSAPRRLCVSTTPVRGSDGVIIAAVGVVEDITGLRAQEAEQQRLRDEERLAKAAAKAQADFIANMNHELRTPGGFCFWMNIKRGSAISDIPPLQSTEYSGSASY